MRQPRELRKNSKQVSKDLKLGSLVISAGLLLTAGASVGLFQLLQKRKRPLFMDNDAGFIPSKSRTRRFRSKYPLLVGLYVLGIYYLAYHRPA